MKLTNGLLAPFVGGQLEVQNQVEGYLYRGEIAGVRIDGSGDDATLVVTFTWYAQGEGYPPIPSRWVTAKNKPYRASLMIYGASDIGQGRVSLYNPYTGELAVLYPKGGSALDPNVVLP